MKKKINMTMKTKFTIQARVVSFQIIIYSPFAMIFPISFDATQPVNLKQRGHLMYETVAKQQNRGEYIKQLRSSDVAVSKNRSLHCKTTVVCWKPDRSLEETILYMRKYFYKQTKEYEEKRNAEFLMLPHRHLNYPY
jgi:hypothetical protein